MKKTFKEFSNEGVKHHDPIKGYNILFDTWEECKNIIEVLYKLGYSIHGYVDIMLNPDSISGWDSVVPGRRFDFCLGHRIDNKIGYSDFMDKYGKIIKLKKIKRPDVDPFEEEDWGLESIEESIENPELGQRVTISDLYRDQYKLPWGRGGNGIGIIRKISTTKIGKINYAEVLWDNGYTDNYSFDRLDFIDNSKISKKIVKPDIDPYGEEDWGWETIEEGKKLKKITLNYFKDKAIVYDDRAEMSKIAKKLVECGFRTYKPVEKYIKSKKLYNFFYYHSGDQAFVRSENNQILKNLTQISFDEFMNLFGKKFKKLDNKEIDPFGEEEWGWEEL